VAFENITPQELSNLIWVLTIGQNADCAHKIGHGKPIGFGSARISVDNPNSYVFSIDEDLNITSTSLSDIMNSLPSVQLSHVAEFKRVSNWTRRFNNVSYPSGKVNGDTTIFNWFVLNREIHNKSPFAHFYQNILPDVMAGNQNLPDYSKVNKRYEPDNCPSNRRKQTHEPGSNPDPTPAEVRFNEEGKCKTCGKPTKINSRNGKYYKYCFVHSPFTRTKN
jgi:hypothetical protein